MIRAPDISAEEPSEGKSSSGVSPLDSRALPNTVTVTGFDREDVLFRGNNVGCVQWRDVNGEILGLLIQIKPNIWGFSRRGDPDWPQVLEQYGNPDV